MPSVTRTRNACLASAESDARKTYFVTTVEGQRAIEIGEGELDFYVRQALIERVRRADVAENIGAVGLIIAAFGVVSMLIAALPGFVSTVSL
jgi:hypothetical protein